MGKGESYPGDHYAVDCCNTYASVLSTINIQFWAFYGPLAVPEKERVIHELINFQGIFQHFFFSFFADFFLLKLKFW